MSTENIDTHQFTFVNELVDKFYEFMANVYIEHKNKVAEAEIVSQIASQSTPTTPTIETPTETIITIDETDSSSIVTQLLKVNS